VQLEVRDSPYSTGKKGQLMVSLLSVQAVVNHLEVKK